LFNNPFKQRIERNKNRNLFNSKTVRYYPAFYTNKTLTSINNNEKEKTINYKINNKENISFNIKQNDLSDLSDIYNVISNINNVNTNKTIIRNSQNSSESKCPYYTLTRNGNNSLLKISEKTNTSNIIIHDKESLPIYNWLKEIELLIYLSLFLKKKKIHYKKLYLI